MKEINTKWDTELLKELPSEVEISEDKTNEDERSDWLSDEFGFCHYGFELVNQEETL